ncbi:putative membrane protein [Pseudomonas aeruginosa]|nr:putative membrane protein [Pseudomonas aeruginosa]AWE68921.1 putative membrane protein [Pseudomonas aeruginosa]
MMSATDEREAKEITRILYVNTVFAVVLFWSMAVGRHPFL